MLKENRNFPFQPDLRWLQALDPAWTDRRLGR